VWASRVGNDDHGTGRGVHLVVGVEPGRGSSAENTNLVGTDPHIKHGTLA